MNKKVGVLGSGSVAKVLARGFLSNGHDVMMGTRDATKLGDFQKQQPAVKVGSFDQAAAYGELIVLAVKGIVAGTLVTDLASHLSGKTVIDTTNPIAAAPPVNGVLKYFTNLDESLMERLQRAVPKANFVKAFNSVGNEFMVNPKISGGPPTMFIAGNSDNARKEVTDVLKMFGWDICDLGKAESARAIEPLCMLWCIPLMQGGGRNHAFKLLKG
jgi:8-hydroxy-5-deazaflavin:NADPH oxidoreductase